MAVAPSTSPRQRPDASTLDVVRNIREALPGFQSAIPDDIKVSFEFDQSFYVTDALRRWHRKDHKRLAYGPDDPDHARSLQDRPGAWCTTIPVALLSALVALWATGQSLNLMTLGGLTLAIGVLVDESVVAVENIHTHFGRDNGTARSVLEASKEVVIPRLPAMLSVVAVFVLPSS